MNRTTLIVASLLATGSGSASGQTPGVNLSWDDCLASVAGGLNKTSTCDSNTEAQKTLYGSYVFPTDAEALAGNEIVINIMTNTGTLPCWWNFVVAPRTTGYSVQSTRPAPPRSTTGARSPAARWVVRRLS